MELCCSTSCGSGISSVGASVVVGGCVVVTGALVVPFSGSVMFFALKSDINSQVLINATTIKILERNKSPV